MGSATTDRRMGLTGDKGMKAPATLATTGNIVLNGEQVIDGVQTSSTRVLVKNQTNPVQNGLYDTGSGNWTRCIDANGNQDLARGTLVLVTDGSTNAGFFYQLAATNPVLPDSSAMPYNLSLTASAALLLFLQAGTGAVARSSQDKMRETLSVFDFMTAAQIADVIARTYTQDVTLPWQTALSAATVLKAKLKLNAGGHKITSQISLPDWSFLAGEKSEQYAGGFGLETGGTVVKFQPTVAATDLFVATGATSGGFRFHYSIEGLYLIGNANSANAINLDHVIYGRFSNIATDGFTVGLNCNGTINNRFENCYWAGSVSAVNYVGNNETTDVYEQCSFWNGQSTTTPIGVLFNGSSLGIRFNNCLWEQLGLYGMQIAKDCQNIMLVDAYCEDVPFTNVATGAMFKIGYNGTTLSSEQQLTVIGGKFAGRNAGTVGSFIDADSCNGVTLVGVDHSRFTTIIKTTANTRANSINVLGCSGVGWTDYTNHAGTPADVTRLSGIYPSGVNNAGGQSLVSRLLTMLANTIGAADGGTSSMSLAGGGITFTAGAANAAYPTADNSYDFGLDANRWKSVRAGYMRMSVASVAGSGGTVTIGGTVATTVGAAGGATALPATPLGYIIGHVGGTQVKIPYYNP